MHDWVVVNRDGLTCIHWFFVWFIACVLASYTVMPTLKQNKHISIQHIDCCTFPNPGLLNITVSTVCASYFRYNKAQLLKWCWNKNKQGTKSAVLQVAGSCYCSALWPHTAKNVNFVLTTVPEERPQNHKHFILSSFFSHRGHECA